MARGPLVGLDIGEDYVRIAELKKQGKMVVLHYADSEMLPDGATVDAKKEAIKKLFSRAVTKNKNIVIAMPTENVIIKKKPMLSRVSLMETEEILNTDGKQDIGLDMDLVQFDFQYLNDENLLILACRKDLIDDRVALCEECGLNVVAVESENTALLNAYQYTIHNNKASVIIIDVGYYTTVVLGFDNGIPIYSKEHKTGISKLDSLIAEKYGLSLTDAMLSRRKNNLPPDFDAAILRPFQQLFSTELFRAADILQASVPDIKDPKIILSGHTHWLLNIAPLLQDKTGLDVELFNMPLSCGPKTDKELVQPNNGPIALAIGLSLRGVC
jgi:type IV pilus assembly protein PilM